MNNLNQETAVMRGVRTAIQAVVGLLIGLTLTVWAVPGVPAAIVKYLEANLLQVALTVGIPAGLTSFVWNALRKDVPTT